MTTQPTMITTTQQRVFDTLDASEVCRTLTWLAEETGLARPSVKAAVDSLSRKGLVEQHGIGCENAGKYRVVADRCEHGDRDSLACPSCQVDRILGRVG